MGPLPVVGDLVELRYVPVTMNSLPGWAGLGQADRPQVGDHAVVTWVGWRETDDWINPDMKVLLKGREWEWLLYNLEVVCVDPNFQETSHPCSR